MNKLEKNSKKLNKTNLKVQKFASFHENFSRAIKFRKKIKYYEISNKAN